MTDRVLRDARLAMVRDQIEGRGIDHQLLLEAMRRVPRHLFVSDELADHAYEDRPLPIGEGQTISQPYIAAQMIAAAEVQPGERVLEVGSGSGYVAALLSTIGARVVAIETRETLFQEARERLASLGIESVDLRCDDGRRGARDKAPFDVILVSATAGEIPPLLLAQLGDGGRLVIPLEEGGHEELKLVRKTGLKVETARLGAVRFVPLV